MVHRISAVILPVALVSSLLGYAYSAVALPRGISGKDQSDAVSFMMRYGYLEPKNPRLGEVRTKKELVRGIKQLQEFAGLKVTGQIDAETVKLIKTPRCSMPDFGPSDSMRRRKRYALHHSQWKKLHLTYTILNTSKEELKKFEVRIAIRKAFDMWTKVSPLTFTEVFTGEADIRISFEAGTHQDAYPFDGRGGTIAHAFYPHDNIGEDGDVHFDNDEHWTLDEPKRGTNFLWTAVHEIGHAIGLDHSSYYDAIMFPYYTGYKSDLKLNEDDVMAIQSKYGKPVESTVPPSTDPTSVTGPSPCDTSFDAVFQSKNGNTYFFKEPYFWTLDKYGRMLGAKKIVDFWPKLKAKVQAAYTRRDGKTVFFKGRRYWIFEGTKYIDGPKLISDYGLPLEMKRLDAVFTWGGNGKTYFFKGHQYWRYNEKMEKIDPGYPKNISDGWGAMRYPVDSVMTWKDGNSYFFKGMDFVKYKFSERHLYQPEKISKFFFKCEEEDTNVVVAGTNYEEEGELENGVTRTTMFAPLMVLLVMVASHCNYW